MLTDMLKVTLKDMFRKKKKIDENMNKEAEPLLKT